MFATTLFVQHPQYLKLPKTYIIKSFNIHFNDTETSQKILSSHEIVLCNSTLKRVCSVISQAVFQQCNILVIVGRYFATYLKQSSNIKRDSIKLGLSNVA